ncbi:MAG: hypothetical protein ACYS74_22615 [Planctomycetota bacterium]
MVYRGMCDASAAVALDEETFVVAGDGSNILRVYKTTGAGMPVSTCDLTDFLGSKPVDIEGVARVGDRIYWIGSHSRDRQGQVQPSRYRFFATIIKSEIDIEPVGKPCAILMKELVGLKTVRGMRPCAECGWARHYDGAKSFRRTNGRGSHRTKKVSTSRRFVHRRTTKGSTSDSEIPDPSESRRRKSAPRWCLWKTPAT